MKSIFYLLIAGKRLHAIVSFFSVVIAFCAQAQEAGNSDDLLSQIESLQSRMNIQIIGLEKIDIDEIIHVRGSPEQQLQQMLRSYNYIISRTKKGKIEKVVIIDKKQQNVNDRIVLPARYEDGHFVVSLSVSGNGKFWETLDMIIDTGADLIVLPKSMIDKLGLVDGALTERKMQTANGTVDAKIGALKEVRIPGEVLNDVTVAFIDDRLLANKSLLGMSALGRYKLVIDNQSRMVTLFKQ